MFNIDGALRQDGKRFAQWFSEKPEAWLRLQPFSAKLGVCALELRASDGFARLSYDVPVEFCNFRGVLHGGIVTSLLDDAAGIAAGVLVGAGFRGTVNAHVAFISPVRAGKIEVVASVIEARGTLMFVEASLHGVGGGGHARGCFTQSYGELRPVRPE